jgi:hypothetical protein
MRANDRNRARIAVVGEITPAAQRGALLAIGTAVASSAGLLAPYIMGVLLRPPRHRSTGSTPASSCAGSLCWWAAPSPWRS